MILTCVNSISGRWHFKAVTTVGDTFYNFLCLYLSLSLSVDGLSGTLGKQNFDPVDLTNEPHTDVHSLLKRLKEEGVHRNRVSTSILRSASFSLKGCMNPTSWLTLDARASFTQPLREEYANNFVKRS